MDAAVVSIPVSLTALVGVAFAAGKISQKVESVRELVAEMKRDQKEAARDAEARATLSANSQGTRLGLIEDKLAVLKDFKARMEGMEQGRQRERADTRGVPLRGSGGEGTE